LVLVSLGVLALLASACTGIASPEGWASPVQSDDDLLLVAHKDHLHGLEPERLNERWSFPSENTDDDIDLEALYGRPALIDSTVLVPAYDGAVYALDSETGVAIWRFDTGEPLIGGVLVSSNTAYFGSSDGNIYALDVDSGDPRWLQPFETGDEVWSTPALSGDTLYVTSLDGNLYALDASTGAELWSFSTDAGIVSPPVVSEAAGLVFVGGLDSQLRAIDIETHEERWAIAADNWFWTRPLVAGGVVYAGSLDGSVYAVEASTGNLRWPKPFATEAPIRAAPLIVDDVLIVVDREGNVYGIDPSDGSRAVAGTLRLGSDVLSDPLARAASGQNGSTASEEVVVVTTAGDLVRIDPSTLSRVGSELRLD
jgi:outer membrane protein assembly factor BamB